MITKAAPLARIGAVFIILYCLNVIYQLRKTKAKQPNIDITNSILEQLTDYREYVLEERKLLRNVLYWYLLPMIPGLILFFKGTGVSLVHAVVYFAGVGIVFFLIYRLNQRAVQDKFRTLIDDIDRAIATLEEKNG